MPESSLRSWVSHINSFAPTDRPRILDVGAGTGMFAAPLATLHTTRHAVAVDPSIAMLAQARRYNSAPRLHYVVGDAGALPVAAKRFDLALLSRVIHHFPDRRRSVLELKRVLRPGGVVVVRTTLREHLDSVVYDYWPRLREVDQLRFPARDEVVADFHAAGFATMVIESFAQRVHPSLRALHEVLTGQPQSKFQYLSETEFADGLASLRRDADTEARPGPVNERYDVLVFEAQ